MYELWHRKRGAESKLKLISKYHRLISKMCTRTDWINVQSYQALSNKAEVIAAKFFIMQDYNKGIEKRFIFNI